MWQKPDNNARPGRLLLAVGISCMITAGSLTATVASGFRVTPYVQNPSQHAVTLIWFSDSDSAGKIELRWTQADGDGLRVSGYGRGRPRIGVSAQGIQGHHCID